MNEKTVEQVAEASDTIDVPDELLEVMGGASENKETEEKPEERPETEEKPTDAEATATEKKEPEQKAGAAKDEPHAEQWKPKHNPEYYKEKGLKTREHIKDLTTRRYEADQRAEAAEREAAELREQLDEARAKAVLADSGHAAQVKQIDEAIELAEEDGNTFVVETLREKRDALMSGGAKPASVPQQPAQQQQPPAQPQIDPAAQAWVDNNEWFGAIDDLGRVVYPHLMAEARQREAILRQSMPIGADLYKRLDEEMSVTLEAWDLAKKRHGSNGAEKPETPREQPRAGLQPSRTGGAEGVETTKKDGLTAEEHKRMVFLAKQTGKDHNEPAYRKAYIRQIRG